MRITHFKIFFLLLILSISNRTYAQDWVDMMQNPEVNFYDVQKAFNKYWEGKEVGRSKGWKQYKRWEYKMIPRVYPTGNRVQSDIAFTEYFKFKKSKSFKSSSSSNWQALGPFNKPANGGEAGRINCIAFHPTDPNIMYVGSPSGGLWKSINGGNSWIPLTDNLPVVGITDIVVDYSNPDIVYVATGDGDASDTYSIGILKSTNGGQNFNTTGLSYTVQQKRTINKLIINPLNPNTLFVATSLGVLRSYDGGATWKNSSYDYTKDIVYKPGDTTVLYYTTKTNFYKSTNSGVNFFFKTVSFYSTTNRINIGVSPANPSYVYLLAGKASDHSYNGVYRSTDNGETFTTRSTSPNIFDWSTNGTGSGGQSWYDMAIVVSPTNADEIYVGGINIWKSSNGGTNWGLVGHWYGGNNKPYVHADIHALRYSPANHLYACNDGGVSKTTNGGLSWVDRNNGISIGQIYRMSVSKTQSSKLVTGWQDNGTNLLNNNVWSKINGGDGMDCLIDYSDPNVIYVSTPNGEISVTSNNGANYANISDDITAQEEGAWVTPFVQHPTNSQTIYAGYINMWKTTNRGINWTRISNFITTDQIKSIAIAPSNPNTIYCATDGNINKTTDGGTTWTPITSGLPSNAITYIAVSNTNANVLWITLSGYTNGNKIFESRNGGATWTNISGNLPNIPANCVAFHNLSNEGLYVGMDVGIYYKDSTLTDWVLYSNYLPNVIVNDLEISYSNSKIRAATYGRGVWESPLYTPNSISENELQNEDITVFPSPTIDKIMINTVSLQNKEVEIKIYDVNGKLILSNFVKITNENYTIDFTGKPNGNYFVKIKTDGKNYNGRFIKISE